LFIRMLKYPVDLAKIIDYLSHWFAMTTLSHTKCNIYAWVYGLSILFLVFIGVKRCDIPFIIIRVTGDTPIRKGRSTREKCSKFIQSKFYLTWEASEMKTQRSRESCFYA
jgi:hypothetical protein